MPAGPERYTGRVTPWRELALLLAALVVLPALPAAAASPGGARIVAETRVDPAADPRVPPKAYAVLAEIRRRGGEPPPGHVGGRAFMNRERRLPPGQYREYDVNPRRPGRGRGTERLVIERRTGQAWYTPDHYESFVPMR